MKTNLKHPITILPYPVKRSGTYFNTTTRRYEFWLYLGEGKEAKVGECDSRERREIVITWRAVTLDAARKWVDDKIEKGLLILSADTMPAE